MREASDVTQSGSLVLANRRAVTSSLKDRVSAPSRFRLEWPERCFTPGRGAIDRATSGDATELWRSMRKPIRNTLQHMKNEIIRSGRISRSHVIGSSAGNTARSVPAPLLNVQIAICST
jgi:hypothetical protein